MAEISYFSHEQEPIAQLSRRLTAPDTSLQDRIRVAGKLFPEKRKRSLLASTEQDRHGRPATCFRVTNYPELAQLLEKQTITALSRPDLESSFLRDEQSIRHNLQRAIAQLSPQQAQALDREYNYLKDHFQLKNYALFVLQTLPRRVALELHSRDGMSGNIQGLISLSIGAPFLPPLNPSDLRGDPTGVPVVELCVPPEQMIIQPLDGGLREMEKEVDVLQIKAEWILDLYQGEEDFENRFIQDPRSVLHHFWGQGKTHDGYERMQWSAYDTLQDWKLTESVADLIPVSKIPELDINNPIYQRPIVEEGKSHS